MNDILKDLTNSNNPLLLKFKELAPGTFKHCMSVMSFCDSIADELGLDVDLLRAASMYHDIGKMNNPSFFGENQDDEANIHDDLDPFVSYHLITRHVGDSVLVLIQNIPDVPLRLLDVISQHHGNTVLKYFYNKSKSSIEEVYRYKCKPPQTIEAAVLMICDSVEATSKSLSNNGEMKDQDGRRKVVDDTIKSLIEDNQLDEMRVGELKVIRKTLYRELDSIYHKRVIYEDEKVKDKKDAVLLDMGDTEGED